PSKSSRTLEVVSAAYRKGPAVEPGQFSVLEVLELAVQQGVQPLEDLEGEQVEGFTAKVLELFEGGEVPRGEPQDMSPRTTDTAFRRGQVDLVLPEVRPEQDETGGRRLAGQ